MNRRHLTVEEANQAIGFLLGGAKQTDVADHFNVTQSVISRLNTRFNETGSARERPRNGRPRSTNAREDRLLVRGARMEPTRNCTLLSQDLFAASRVRITPRTVLNRLNEVGLHCYRPIRRPPLTANHRVQRLQWCEEKINWRDEWNTVMFTDESRFCLHSDRRTVRVWRPPNSRVDDRYVQNVHAFGGGSVMVWAGIFLHGRTELHVCEGTMNGEIYARDIVTNILNDYRWNLEPNFRFLDDNARPHRARIVLEQLEINEIDHLRLPPLSPDLNCIEHVWDMLGRALIDWQPPVRDIRTLSQILPDLWDGLDQELINTLILSMPRRIQAVIANRGGITRY